MNPNLKVIYLPIKDLKPSLYNPRKWSKEALGQLKESITRFGSVVPLVVNAAPERSMILVGGHMRVCALKELGHTTAPVVFVHISDEKRERELNLRLNRNVGEFDLDLLAEFDETLLSDVGFSSEELDDIFPVEESPEVFDLEKELRKLDIAKIEMETGQVWQLGEHRMMIGDSMIEADILKLMGSEKANMCFTDQPYFIDYVKGKKKHKSAEGFGYKRDRKYLGTDSLPDNFVSLWMANVKKIAQNDFSIIAYECWKNVPLMWAEMSKHWKIRNLIILRLQNRVQGFAAKYRFFNKYDFALLGTSGEVALNNEPESDELLQNEYETALFATSGSPTWESYEKGKKYCPTDFVEFKTSDAKSSGQGIIFGTKPVEVLLPYLKVLTKRDDIVLEPFGGSGSTLIACEKLKRRCRLMEKSPVYAEVIRHRWEKLTGQKAVRIS